MRLAARADYTASIADYDALLSVEPANVAALVGRAASNLKLGRLAGAKADADRAAGIDPKSPVAVTLRSSILLAEGDLDGAARAATEAINLDSRQSAAFGNRAAAHRESGRLPEALADYNAALRIDPYSARLLQQRGLTRFRMGDHDRALADYAAALALKPDDEETRRGVEVAERARAAATAGGAAPARPDADHPAVAVGATQPAPSQADPARELCSDYSEDRTQRVLMENLGRTPSKTEAEQRARKAAVDRAMQQRSTCPAWLRAQEAERNKNFVADLRGTLVGAVQCAPYRSRIEASSGRAVGPPALEQQMEAAVLQLAMGQKDQYCRRLADLIGPYLELRDIASQCSPGVAVALHQSFGAVAEEAKRNGCR